MGGIVMEHIRPTISLGFTQQEFSAGVHICQIFSNDDERQEALLKFLVSGLQSGEQARCFSEKVNATILSEFFGNYGISYGDVMDSGAFALSGTRDIYFQNDRFDPEQMLRLLKHYYMNSMKQGFPAARVIGEMTSEIQHVSGGSRLLEYESKVSLLLREYPVTAVCQYDAREFDGAMIMDILKVHPLMVVRGSVVHNPFYIRPEEFLSH
jgi:hypothetical protein